MSAASACAVKWCNEDGEHAVHRQYVKSLPVWQGAWVVGVNVAQPSCRRLGIEFTATTRRGLPVIIPFEPGEAEHVGRALLRAASRALRLPKGG